MIPDRCSHEHAELRRFLHSNNTVHLCRQCATCGEKLEYVKKTSIPPEDFDATPVFNEYKRDQKREETQHACVHHDDARSSSWWDRYNDYLKSPEWQDRRMARLIYDRRKCQACLSGCTWDATQVHHITYKHLGNEPVFDLVSVCETCHSAITAMDRGGSR